MKVQLITPLRWSAALVPRLQMLLANGRGSLVLSEDDAHHDGPMKVAEDVSTAIVYVDSSNVAEVAEVWLAAVENRSESGTLTPPWLVVVGAGSLRYEWELRELGAVAVVGDILAVSRVTMIVERQLQQRSVSSNRWPHWIHDRVFPAAGESV